MSPHTPEVHTALRMMPILKRGCEAMALYIDSLEPRLRPVVPANIHVVTHADYVANAELVLRHVVHNGVTTHVLCLNGSLCALIQKRNGNW